MKKILYILLFGVLLFTYTVNAKNTVTAYNKYYEEEYKYILNSYNADNKKDGHIVLGTYIKSQESKEEKNLLLVKYNQDEKIEWEYLHDIPLDNECTLNYLYEENQIKGYLLSIREKDTNYLLKIDLNGKLKEKINSPFTPNTKVQKIEEIIINNTLKGYIAIGVKEVEDKKISFLARLDENLNLTWEKEYQKEDESSLIEIIPTIEEDVTGYVSLVKNNKDKYSLIKFDSTGNEIKQIKTDFEEKDIPHLEKTDKGYIVYGYTYEVKLDDGKNTSYYVVKYNNNDETEWETIGTSPVSSNKAIKLQVNKIQEKEEYLIMTTNEKDASIEITKIDSEGTIGNKIKKINNDYYDITTYLFDDNTIYFIGQVNCPEDDTCAYNKKALYLISDEDKVIEVEDDYSTLIIVIGLSIIIFIGFIIFIRKRIKGNQV